MCIGFHVPCSLFLSDFNEKNYFDIVLKKQISNFMKTLQLEPSFSRRTDGRIGQTDRQTRPTTSFPKFFLRV